MSTVGNTRINTDTITDNLVDQLAELSTQLSNTADVIRDGTTSLETETQECAKFAKAAKEILELVKHPQDDALD